MWAHLWVVECPGRSEHPLQHLFLMHTYTLQWLDIVLLHESAQGLDGITLSWPPTWEPRCL
jgi:hypothetical protein